MAPAKVSRERGCGSESNFLTENGYETTSGVSQGRDVRTLLYSQEWWSWPGDDLDVGHQTVKPWREGFPNASVAQQTVRHIAASKSDLKYRNRNPSSPLVYSISNDCTNSQVVNEGAWVAFVFSVQETLTSSDGKVEPTDVFNQMMSRPEQPAMSYVIGNLAHAYSNCCCFHLCGLLYTQNLSCCSMLADEPSPCTSVVDGMFEHRMS